MSPTLKVAGSKLNSKGQVSPGWVFWDSMVFSKSGSGGLTVDALAVHFAEQVGGQVAGFSVAQMGEGGHFPVLVAAADPGHQLRLGAAHQQGGGDALEVVAAPAPGVAVGAVFLEECLPRGEGGGIRGRGGAGVVAAIAAAGQGRHQQGK